MKRFTQKLINCINKCYNKVEVVNVALAMGKFNELEVLRKTDFSYILFDGETEVFLHLNQAKGELEIGSTVRVFMYFDNQRRKTATRV